MYSGFTGPNMSIYLSGVIVAKCMSRGISVLFRTISKYSGP
ncbi:hypothetical protein NT05LM_3076, partial [Listeria marthii FSL S4-120]